jgi:UDP-3-O-[3-hydroxymyristoyl] glucosamine N-acyltransferase
MSFFFKNKGPFDLNYIIENTLYTKKKKFKKKKIKNISSLNAAKKDDITFFNNLAYLKDLKNSKAGYCLIEEKYSNLIKNINLNFIISLEPLLDFIIIAKLFYPDADQDNYLFNQNNKFLKLRKSKNVLIDKTVKIGKNFNVGLNTVLKKNIVIGDNVTIGSNCTISNCVIKDNVKINDGTVIGKIGFGFKSINKKITFIPHIGYVEIHENAYIGSNCTLDRGSFSNTIIGKGTMIDNQVHIAHNVKIGSDCFIAGQTGIAGSTKIGNSCLIGGKSGISGHLMVGDNVYIGGQSGVLKSIKSNEKVMGYPATSMRKFVKQMKHD